MIIPDHYRRTLRAIGHPHWFWYQIGDWAFGERFKFKNGDIAYIFRGEIVTIRRGVTALWNKEDVNG